MSLKQNLLKKRSIDHLTENLLHSIGSADSTQKLDREQVRSLLDIAGYRMHRERDLELYMPPPTASGKDILVLDNDLPFYRTTVSDIVLRKSPTIKEMISIKNAIRILNDSDVVVSKKADSIRRLQQECTDTLDLRITESGLDELVQDGIDALRNRYPDGVRETLALFSELLHYQPVPRPFAMDHHIITGAVMRKTGDVTVVGPVVVFSLMHNNLLMIHRLFSSHLPEDIDRFGSMVTSPTDEVLVGEPVFWSLKTIVLRLSSIHETT